jgi:maltose alpha-D-glucosyltransferase/alpha-amylase
VLTRDYPFAYIRGGSHLVVVNPRRAAAAAGLVWIAGRNAHPLEVNGTRLQDGQIVADGFGYGVFALA